MNDIIAQVNSSAPDAFIDAVRAVHSVDDLVVNRTFGLFDIPTSGLPTKLHSLRKLSLADLRLGPQALNLILFYLAGSKTLQHLNVSGNRGSSDAVAFGQFLSGCSSLKELNASDNQLTDAVGKLIFEAVGSHPSLVRNWTR